jgi:hypothetical protein
MFSAISGDLSGSVSSAKAADHWMANATPPVWRAPFVSGYSHCAESGDVYSEVYIVLYSSIALSAAGPERLALPSASVHEPPRPHKRSSQIVMLNGEFLSWRAVPYCVGESGFSASLKNAAAAR